MRGRSRAIGSSPQPSDLPERGTNRFEQPTYDPGVRRRLAPLAVLTLLALAMAAAAFADQEQIRLTSEGQAAARAALPKQADFGVGWVGKAYKP